MAPKQTHPLYGKDRITVDRLLVAASPSKQDVTDAARLYTRYRGFPGHPDIAQDIGRSAKRWGFASSAELNARARTIWESGFRPGLSTEEVGSGADVGPVETEPALTACTIA